MKLAISNIAWASSEAPAIYRLLQQRGVSGLEIAPSLLFPDQPDPMAPPDDAVRQGQSVLADFGLQLVSMQSLLFGVQGAQLFGSPDERGRFVSAIKRAIDLAARLGIRNLVVGSPRNRVVPDTMSMEQARDIAVESFRNLGAHARAGGSVLALEPNPAAYGANWLTSIDEACDFVELLGHPGVAVNFDIGSLHMNGEFHQLGALLDRARPLMSHVHISEAELRPVPQHNAQLGPLFQELDRVTWEGWVSVEMRRADKDPVGAVTLAIDSCLSCLPRHIEKTG